MRKIDLTLQKNSKNYENCYLNEAIKNNHLVIILGNPGSGKTSILEKYQEENSNSKYLTVKQFLKLNKTIPQNIDTILLDGLDEYRSVSNDKSFAIEELANNLNQYKDKKIVISCRDLDWYGEEDTKALKDEIETEATLYSILPLDTKQKLELANLLNIENPKNFINTFNSYGFLDNPQMFTMVAKLYLSNSKANFSSKLELYKTFIKESKEKNPNRVKNINNLPTEDEILKITGYLASFYLLSEIDIFTDNIVDKIIDNTKGFSKGKILDVLNTSLFYNRSFIHRTIAEFAFANFLVQEKMQTDISKKRVKNIFVYNNKIPTEFRGTYAWLCALSKDLDLIRIDPYYQALYGDNSLFTPRQKQEIILSVKENSKINPWFINFLETNNKFKNLGFLYHKNLDIFFINSIKETNSLNNHYLDFLIFILSNSDTLTREIKEYLKEIIYDNDFKIYVKDDILKVFKEDINFLKEVLGSIKKGTINDNEDLLKEFLLKILYPKYISSKDIADYLLLYNKTDVIGNGEYLFKTPYEEKLNLANSLLKLKKNFIKHTNEDAISLIDTFTEDFIRDYLYQTILMYPNKKTAQEIYEVIFLLRKNVEEYQELKFEPNFFYNQNEKKSDFSDLAKELFEIHITKAIKKANKTKNSETIINHFVNFDYFFPYSFDNKNIILLNKLNHNNTKEVNKQLYLCALTYLPLGYENKAIDISLFNIYKNIAKEYNLKDELHNRLKEPKWRIRQKRQELIDREKKFKIKRKNEDNLKIKTNNEIYENLDTLKYSANIVLRKKNCNTYEYLEPNTCNRLKKILKSLVLQKSKWQEYATLKEYAKSSTSRNIDDTYYASLILNNAEEIIEKNRNKFDFIGYLYILAVRKFGLYDIKSEEYFIKVIEEDYKTKAKEFLQEYISELFKNHYNEKYHLYKKYISNCKNIEILKNIAQSNNSNLNIIQEDLLIKTISAFWNKINLEELKKLQKEQLKDETKDIVDAIIVLRENNKKEFSIKNAITLKRMFALNQYIIYNNLDDTTKINIIDFWFKAFNTEEFIDFSHNSHPNQSNTVRFIINTLNNLPLNILEELYKLNSQENSIWKNRLLNQIAIIKQQNADKNSKKFSIEKVKSFILKDDILDDNDFFQDIILKLQTIKDEIEANRNNEKKLFYNDNKKPKNEEYCRDVILQKLNDKYSTYIESTKEKHEADNRVDINIKYKKNLDYEVQIECKKDNNQDLDKGIQNQLIDKYLHKNVKYGIYLIFYFGNKKDKTKMLQKLQIPKNYNNKIEIITIDLTIKLEDKSK